MCNHFKAVVACQSYYIIYSNLGCLLPFLLRYSTTVAHTSPIPQRINMYMVCMCTVYSRFFLVFFLICKTKQPILLKVVFLFSAYRKCQPDDFLCGSKTSDPCIPKEKRCNGYLDCRSGKDEQGCSSGVACRLDQFRCSNGQRCVESSQKCDHKNDCGDNSDEQGCSK